MQNTAKRFARRLFHEVMQRVNVSERMRDAFAVHGRTLHVSAHHFDLRLFRQVLMVAVGKAAVPMAEHVIAAFRDALPLTGLVIGPDEWTAPPHVRFLKGDHPVPYTRSLRAAQELLASMKQADRDTLVVYLISGGASALAEVPLTSSITAEDMSAFYTRLLHAGLPIEQTNVLRKHFSAIKGGRLALAAGKATRCTLLLSDVPPGKLDAVGSGPSLPDSSSVAECLRLLAENEHHLQLPPSMRQFAATMPETPKTLPEGRLPSVCVSLLSSDSLVDAARGILNAEGYRVVVDNSCDDWDYRAAAQHLVRRSIEEASKEKPVCLLSAGEVTVTIDGVPGTGGRNQQWALEAARLIQGKPDHVAMSVGSDGIDGNSPAAGAIVDGQTWQRAQQAGFDPQLALDSFNAYPLFAALHDAVAPGASGNNIRDLRVVLIQ